MLRIWSRELIPWPTAGTVVCVDVLVISNLAYDVDLSDLHPEGFDVLIQAARSGAWSEYQGISDAEGAGHSVCEA